VGIGGYFLASDAARNEGDHHSHPVPTLRMHGAIPPPHMCLHAWHRDNFAFYIIYCTFLKMSFLFRKSIKVGVVCMQ
jgi:hypothetical protein